MSLELILKFVSLLAGAFAMWKIVAEVSAGRRSRFREEYRFAREFFADIKATKEMHPFLRQKGYQALAGDNRLSAQEVEYLLSLPQAARALRLYVMGLPYLQHNATAGGMQVDFKPKFRLRRSRRWRQVMYFVLYLFFYVAGAAPAFTWPLRLIGWAPSLATVATAMLICWPLAGFALWSGMRVASAESLVRLQPPKP